MSDLRGARTNAAVEAAIMSRDIDPGYPDEGAFPPLIDFSLEAYDPADELIDSNADDVTVVGWGIATRMPWEVLP